MQAIGTINESSFLSGIGHVSNIWRKVSEGIHSCRRSHGYYMLVFHSIALADYKARKRRIDWGVRGERMNGKYLNYSRVSESACLLFV